MTVAVKVCAHVKNIITYSPDVFEVSFTLDTQTPHCQAGQFLSLALDPYNPHGGRWPESRAFSIARWHDGHTITIVYSVKGIFTQRMRQELNVGTSVWICLPLGKSIITAQDQNHNLTFIAGGTGIAPYIAYLEKELAHPTNRKIFMAYGIRNKQLYFFKDILTTCEQKLPNFKLLLFCEQPLDFDQIYQEAAKLQTPRFFISGPPGMIETCKHVLQAHDVQEEHIHIDSWG